MSPIPDLSDTSIFLDFASCPIENEPTPYPSPTTSPPTTSPSTYLIATFKENMTLSTSPTFILTDRNNTSFALTIRLPRDAVDEKAYMGGFDASRFKKGVCVVVRNPVRRGVKGGKAGYVGVGVDGVYTIPTTLDKLLLVSQYDQALLAQNASTEICGACGKSASSEHVLVRCKGCHGVWYCDKTCQTKGWTQNGHKSECKILKAAGEIWS